MVRIIEFILNTVVAIVAAILNATTDGISELLSKKKSNSYSASFARPADLFQRKGGGFRIGYDWGTNLKDSHSHLICFGGSGSKKSSCVGFPTLLQSHECSYVIFDTSRELYKGTASYLNEIGYTIDVLDYDNAENSIGFNVLAKCKNESDVYRIAQVLTKNALEGSSYDYWAQSSENMIGFFANTLRQYAPGECVNLANVLNMVQVFSFAPEKIDAWVVRKADERTINKYKALVATPDKTLQSTIATATNTLAAYSNPGVATLTSHDTLDFSSLRARKRALYICGSPSMIQYCRGISASFFDTFFSYALSSVPDNGALPITFCIDEAATMRLSLAKPLELGRKHLISIATLWQDYNQVEHIYGKNEAANILANSRTKVYMPSGQPLATCRMLEELLGRYSYQDENGHERTRELLTAQEIFQLKDILVLSGNNKPVLLKPRPYFESKKLSALTQKPVYQYSNPSANKAVKLFNFEL